MLMPTKRLQPQQQWLRQKQQRTQKWQPQCSTVPLTTVPVTNLQGKHRPPGRLFRRHPAAGPAAAVRVLQACAAALRFMLCPELSLSLAAPSCKECHQMQGWFALCSSDKRISYWTYSSLHAYDSSAGSTHAMWNILCPGRARGLACRFTAVHSWV